MLQDLNGVDEGWYWVVVSNEYGSDSGGRRLLIVNGATTDGNFDPGANSGVGSLAIQTDGKILAGGEFTALGGQPRNRLARLNANGTLDTTFNPGANDVVHSVAVQPDGKILVGGLFTTLAGQPRNRIGRLNADGSIDDTFNPGANDRVRCLAVQTDGRILVGGDFTSMGGQTRNRLARLNPNGTVDGLFNPGANNSVYSISIQADDRILVGGLFTAMGGQIRNRIARLNSNGLLDNSFNPGANGSVFCIAVQASGKVLASGGFSMIGGQARSYFAMLNADGTADRFFTPNIQGIVYSMGLQADGKIVIGGDFTGAGGRLRQMLGRLNADGTVDGIFNPFVSGSPAWSWVSSIAMQSDGKILVGGFFGSLAWQPRNNIGELNNTALATQSLDYNGAVITWLRGGSSPEVWRTTFEHSVDGSTWTNLGAGDRIVNGWQLTGVTLPVEGTLRARGFVATGSQYGSGGGIMETTFSAPWPLHLRLISDGSMAILTWSGGRSPYQVQETTNPGQSDSWQDVGTPLQTNSFMLSVGDGSLFLRVRGQ